jgi:nitrate/nitrite transporter NarK
MWWICSQQFFRAAGYMFFGSWFATYLQETRGVTPEGSGFLTMLPLLAVVAGGLLGGGASDWVLARFGSLRWARQGVASAALLACGSLIVSAYFVGDALWAVALISAGSLFHAVAGPCSYAITIDMGGRDVGTVFSVMNMSGNVGAMIFPYVVPWLRNATGGWESILFLFAGMFFAAAICWLLLNPRGAIVDQALVHSSRQGSGDASR